MPRGGHSFPTFRRIDVLELFYTRVYDLLTLARFTYFPVRRGFSSCQSWKSSTCRLHARLNHTSVLYLRSMIAPLRRLFSWGVPTSDALNFVQLAVDQENMLEVGAGTGYWASLLRQQNVYIIPTDVHPCHVQGTNGFHCLHSGNVPPFCRVLKGRPAILRKLVDFRYLFICWPPREQDFWLPSLEFTNMAFNALKYFRGETLLFVGEGFSQFQRVKYRSCCSAAAHHRCSTAGPAFNHTVLADWRNKGQAVTPKWPGAADTLTLWENTQARKDTRCSVVSSKSAITKRIRMSSSIQFALNNEFICAQLGFLTTESDVPKQTCGVISGSRDSQMRCLCAERTRQLSEISKTWAGQMVAHLEMQSPERFVPL